MKTIGIILFLQIFFLNLLNAQQIKVEEYTLENGLTVYLTVDNSKPEVFGCVMVKAGGKNDPSDATGMAHYMEHMLFKGTTELGTTSWEKEKPHIDKIFSLYDELGKTTDDEKRKEIQKKINEESLKAAEFAIPNELSDIINSMGGTNLNAGTGPDNTIFYNAFPPSQMERWLDLYSHRFMEPVFRSFQAELEVVYEEKNMYEDIFFFPLLEKFNENFFKNHPYGQQTLIGTIDDLKNPSLTKMYEFFKTYYVPNNMALIIAGDFDLEYTKKLIEKKFGQLKRGKLPEKKTWDEQAFKGREEVVAKMTPIKLGLLGFRTAPSGHEDEMPLEICNSILSNESQTGLLDRLVLDNKIMAAQALSMPYMDHGATIFLFVPKILGQKLENAEKLILDEIAKVKAGEFEDWMVEAIKHELYKGISQTLETAEGKALMLAEVFVMEKKSDYLNEIIKQINSITKEDVVRIANKYYGDNYLAFMSKMGFPKKQKIEKPGFEPLIANTDATSKYAERFKNIPTGAVKEKYVDFKNDVELVEFEGVDIYLTKNPHNHVFSLKIKFAGGEQKYPMLKYASYMMNMAGTEDLSVNDLKNKFSKLGCSYEIYSDLGFLYINLTGIQKNYRQSLDLLKDFLASPVIDPEKLKNLIDEEKTNRKMEKSEPDNVADALVEYSLYGNQSEYLDRLSLKEIKAIDVKALEETFKQAIANKIEMHYVGQDNIEEIAKYSAGIFATSTPREGELVPAYKECKKYTENTVIFVNKKKALQSKIYFFANGKDFEIDDQPVMDAFNEYFGGGFSGLVLQEVREYRSLAYSAGASFSKPGIKGKPANFIGYVGTQADKTFDALEIFDSLIREMPVKKERMEMIRDYLIQSALSSKPDMRNLSETIVRWKHQGFREDPAVRNIKRYKHIDYEHIDKFYKTRLKEQPVVIMVVGNKKKIDVKEFEKYGKFVSIKEADLFKD
ncbi:MAG: insulinase family protein [Bacteroidales bacterium]|nr:insulinase family protein [Bacteroidales bacterium]